MKRKLGLVLILAGLWLSPPSVLAQSRDMYFTLFTRQSNTRGNFVISGQISIVTQNGQRAAPLRGAPLYVIGPDAGPRKNMIYRWGRTDNTGRYAIAVKESGRYKIFIDPGWAKNKGIKALALRGGEILEGDQLLVEPAGKANPRQGKVFASKAGGYVIQEKIAVLNESGNDLPIAGVVVYIHGPLPLSPSAPHVMLSVKTDKRGYYRAKVNYPGVYEISIDPASAAYKGAYRWTPNSYRIFVE